MGFIGRTEKFEGQKAAVELNQFTMAQDRYIFLRCMVKDTRPEIAQVKVSYTDEINGGVEQSVSGTAKVRFTHDEKRASGSIRADVVAQKEFLLTAVAKDEALAEADAGRYQKAAEKLSCQAGLLEPQCQNAPAPMQQKFRDEVNNLRLRSEQLKQNQYDSSTRKSLQYESYNTRNSKN